MIKAEEYCLLGCIDQIKEDGSRLVNLHVKGVVQVESFAIANNWLVLGGAVSPQPGRSKHHQYTEYIYKK